MQFLIIINLSDFNFLVEIPYSVQAAGNTTAYCLKRSVGCWYSDKTTRN